MYKPINRKVIQRGASALYGENTLADFKNEKYKEAKETYQNFCMRHKLNYEPKQADAWATAWSETYSTLTGEQDRIKLIQRLNTWRLNEAV
jgi:hypothetical protein